MHVAAYYGNVSVVLMLLQNGGSPDVTNMVSVNSATCSSISFVRLPLHYSGIFRVTFGLIKV